MQKEAVAITDAEWEVMRVVWSEGETTSKTISAYLNKALDWKEATTKTLIGRLVNKGALKTEKDGRRFIYSALISEDSRVEYATREVFDHVCATRKGHYVNDLVDNMNLTQDDIAQLIQTLENKKESAPKDIMCECADGQCDCHVSQQLDKEEHHHG